VTDEEVRSPANDLVGEVEQRVEDVVGAAQRFGSDCLAHSREVRIDPPQLRNAVENQLEASLSLAMVDAGAVEYQHGSTGPVLHVVDHHLAHSDLHPRRLTAQGASRQRGPDRGSRCRPALEWGPVILSTAGSADRSNGYTSHYDCAMISSRPALGDAALLAQGKIRNLFAVDEETVLVVATDQISAFDAVLATEVPDKGTVLTALSLWWFEQLGDVVPNHLITANVDAYPEQLAPYRDELRGRSMLCKRLDMIQVECVMRGYLAGSGLADYQTTGAVSGHELPSGLKIADRLPQNIFTPAIKAAAGGHDENISVAAASSRFGEDLVERLERASRALYRKAASIGQDRGIIIADTKFEFGRATDGSLTLGDEIFTPDSSRFWYAEEWRPGQTPASLDKQPVRDWLISKGLRGEPAALPEDVVEATRQRYVDAYERLTGRSMDAFKADMGL
jgi:phosphoribosylaminoimidazole-succinocarboxamide synthase